MASISTAHQNSLLAQAGYIELPSNFSGLEDAQKKSALINSLEIKGMSTEDATKFASEYTVFDTINDPITGLQATVFEKDGVKTLSIAGTDPGSILDIVSDFLDIGLAGGAELQPQYAALKNFYASLNLGVEEKINVAGHSLGGFLA